MVREYPLEVGVVCLQDCLDHVREEEVSLFSAFDEEKQTDGKDKKRKKYHNFSRLELVSLLK